MSDPSQHECPFGSLPEAHSPFTGEKAMDALSYLMAFTCPLCMHDLFTKNICIECGHVFTLSNPPGFFPAQPAVLISALEDIRP